MASRGIATHNGPPSKTNIPPSQTLYITSLPPSRILPKTALRLSLYTLFSTHGPILDIVALRTAKMRNQAHVVFRDVRDAAAALRAEDGREFFGQELRVQFARGRSHVLGRLDGTLGLGKVGAGAGGEGGEVKSLQQAIFGGVPGVSVGAVASLPPIPPPSIVAPVQQGQGEKVEGKGSGDGSRGTSEGPQGVKRAREESDEEGAPMEEESDEDVEMEEESDSD